LPWMKNWRSMTVICRDWRMAEITEGRLRFRFPAGWDAVKFDETPWYRQAMQSRSKAMDILAMQGQSHWWIEVKDCMGFEADNMPRLAPGDPVEVDLARSEVKNCHWDKVVSVSRKKAFIVDEVAEKLEGTLLCLMAAQRAGAAQADAHAVQGMAGVVLPVADWCVVLVLCWDTRDFKRLAMRLRDKLVKRLAAYHVRCFVLNEGEATPMQPWTSFRMPS